MNPQDLAYEFFLAKFGKQPAFVSRAPGRVNLLGEHVDYNDGFVLPAAIDRATYVAFASSESNITTIWAANYKQQAVFSTQSIQKKQQIDDSPLPEWAYYPAGVMWSLQEAQLDVPGMNAVFSSDVPCGAGLSSSASVEMAFGIAWSKLGGWSIAPLELAKLGQKAENKYVGVNCGIMDQFASACGEVDRLLYLDCRSLTWDSYPLPQNVAIVVADTSIRRKLSCGEYNKRRNACDEAVKRLKVDLPHITSLRDVDLIIFNKLASKLPLEVEKRARHVVEEIERSKKGISLLEKGDMDQFGELMNACHTSLRDFFEVSSPELDIMVHVAQSMPECYGARLTGAGFGGCTVSLVQLEKADAFAQSLAIGYEAQTKIHPEIYVCRASEGASLIGSNK